MLSKIQSLNADFEESNELTKFIAYLNGYNKGDSDSDDKSIDKFKNLEKEIIEFFEYKWKNDHN